MNRRKFIRDSALLAGATWITTSASATIAKILDPTYLSKRPPIGSRTFTSPVIEETIKTISASMSDKHLAWLFENCYPNTLDTTVEHEIVNDQPDTFIITGDIDAMWLRDSTAQVWPYMIFTKQDPALAELIKGLIHRQALCILKDPYANAFYKDLSKRSEWESDKPSPIPGVHERKWEIDSLCYPVRLAYHYYKMTGDNSPFDDHFKRAMQQIYNTFKTEQRIDGTTPYRHSRVTSNPIDTPPFYGQGQPVKYTGMICSAFRPSDDSTIFPYLIPSNLFALESLKQLAFLSKTIYNDKAFADNCESMASEIKAGVEEHGIIDLKGYGKIYAYEVDGFGGRLLMDDANVPSLISLSYLGIHKPEDELYQRTREFVLSNRNPWYQKGRFAEGMGSPHTGRGSIWPMGIILRGLTSTDDREIKNCLEMLKNTHANTGFMHESFNPDNPESYTRSWFAWANTLFGELIVKLWNERPHLLKS